jgi:hypothetical protein
LVVVGTAFAPSAEAQRTAAPSPTSTPSSAKAGPPAEIVAARELFRQGTEDADTGRYEDGLEKFRRVAKVKETAAVRFNIARCEEALGRVGSALADFEIAAREGRVDGSAEDVAHLAQGRADALRPQVPRLTLIAPTLPAGMSVSLDGAPLSVAALGEPLPVDPGPHVLEASAPGSATFQADLTLKLGESKTEPIVFTPGGPAAGDAAASGAASSQRTWGYVALGAGGALAVGSLVFLLLHNGAVSTLNGDCPGGQCQASQEAQVNSTESDARTDQTLSIAFAATAAAALGTGVVLLLTTPKAIAPQPATSLVTGAPRAPAGLSLRMTF